MRAGTESFATETQRRGFLSASGDCRRATPEDVRPVGEGVSELRIDYGPGYRVYFLRIDGDLAVLLLGGDKSTQRQDVERARELARELVKGGSS